MKQIAITTLLLLSLNCFAKDKVITVKTIDSAKRFVLPVVCGYEDENHKFQTVGIAGTGFLVESGRFVTMGHVLDNWDTAFIKARHACVPAVYFPLGGWKTFNKRFDLEAITIGRCQRDYDLDLAVCELTVNPFTDKRISVSIVAFDTIDRPEGTEIAFTGFPNEYTVPITSIGHVAGLISIDHTENGYDYIMDKAAWPGASGSPVFLADGRVIGIIRQRGSGDLSGIAIARSAAVIVEFLSKHPTTKAAPQTADEKK
jgi:V8-like Glu-specific endopeptidase